MTNMTNMPSDIYFLNGLFYFILVTPGTYRLLHAPHQIAAVEIEPRAHGFRDEATLH